MEPAFLGVRLLLQSQGKAEATEEVHGPLLKEFSNHGVQSWSGGPSLSGLTINSSEMENRDW